MRQRKQSYLVATTCDDEKKRAIAEKNFVKKMRTIYVMSVFGKQTEITKEQYVRLKKSGINVMEMVV